MTRYSLFWVGIVLVAAGASLLTYLAVSYRSIRYARKGGPGMHPRWMYRDTSGSVYSSRNDRPS